MQDLFTQLNPAEAAIIATVFSALLILAIILSVRAYFYQAHAKQQAEQLTDSYKSIKDAIDENLRLKTENESLATRCTNLLASLAEMEHHAAKNKALLVEQEKTHQQAVENAAKYARCLEFIKVQKKTILLENGESMPNPVLYWLEKEAEVSAKYLEATKWLHDNGFHVELYARNVENEVIHCLSILKLHFEQKQHALSQIKEAQLEGSKFYHECKQFVDQNNLVENSGQRSDNVVIEALHSLAGKVINYDKEIGRIRAEFEKYGAKFKTRANTAGQIVKKLDTMHRKVSELVEAAIEIPKKGQVPRAKYNRLLTAAGKCAIIETYGHEVREGGVCA